MSRGAQDYNAVFTETSSIKNLTQTVDTSKPDKAQEKGNEQAPMSPQVTLQSNREFPNHEPSTPNLSAQVQVSVQL